MADDILKIGTASCLRGSRGQGWVEVAPGPDGRPLGFPVLLVNGAQPGPRLCIGAGIHGDEYESMEAVRRLLQETDPCSLRGALIGLPCINPPAFQAGSRISPVDHLNLNRVFPGDANGTLSLRWAATFVREVIPNIDAFVDLHNGGAAGLIAPCTIVQGGYDDLAMPLGVAVGNDLLWKGGAWGGTARISTLQAGKPAVTVEIGGGGGFREETVSLHLTGLHNVMRVLKLVDGNPVSPREYKVIQGTLRQVSSAGFFRAAMRPGQAVKADEVLATVVNHFGETAEVLRAPRDGVVLWMRSRPPILPGDDAVVFAEVVDRITP